LLYFFFSSRRRHTRFSRDWSSDVCSSDLLLLYPLQVARKGRQLILGPVLDVQRERSGEPRRRQRRENRRPVHHALPDGTLYGAPLAARLLPVEILHRHHLDARQRQPERHLPPAAPALDG